MSSLLFCAGENVHRQRMQLNFWALGPLKKIKWSSTVVYDVCYFFVYRLELIPMISKKKLLG